MNKTHISLRALLCGLLTVGFLAPGISACEVPADPAKPHKPAKPAPKN